MVTSKVGAVKLSKNITDSFAKAMDMIGGITDLSSSRRNVVIKVGIFSPKSGVHSTVNLVQAIVNYFKKAPKIYIAESDNYRGKALERLSIWNDIFTDRVMPYDLSNEDDTKPVTIAGINMRLSGVLFKPNILVSTHILRHYERGSIIKNLFGCTQTRKKAQFHKEEIFYPLLADIFEVLGGIDLSVLDGTYFWRKAASGRVKAGYCLVSRDALALETVGAYIAGMKIEKMKSLNYYAHRGLGEGDLSQIEVSGIPLEELKQELKSKMKKK